MLKKEEYLNKILCGDNQEILDQLPAKSVDLIFADPPYNLQLKNELYRPNQTKVDAVNDHWDQFSSFEAYDAFTASWLKKCRRVLKDNGTLWVIGSYHNIYRVGSILQNLGYWFLNDIVWIKTNPMPNFRGTRFNNSHETLLWVAKGKESRYTFHYKSMKAFNDDLQMRSDWQIPICNGTERIKHNGQKAHSTQKPAELLYRIIISTSNENDVVLDPFMGSGTTGAVAKRLRRNFIGIEKEKFYVEIANKRIANILPIREELARYKVEVKPPRVPFGTLIEKGIIRIGEILFSKDKQQKAMVLANATIETGETCGSIHKVSAKLLQKQSNNGWTFWYVERDNALICIDDLRQSYLKKYYKKNSVSDKLFKAETKDIISKNIEKGALEDNIWNKKLKIL